MNYEAFFRQQLSDLRREGRYRVFADLERQAVPAMGGDPVRCRQIGDRLLDRFGIYVQPIDDPTVPRGTERLRLTPSPLHSEADIDHLVRALAITWSNLDRRRAA